MSDATEHPRAIHNRAPDPMERGGWIPMRQYDDGEEVDFAIVGTGAGGGVLAAKLAAAGFSVVAFDAGAFFRPLEDFASDERAQRKLYWLDDRISDGDDPLTFGDNNSGQAVGGSTVHFQMVTLRFRPEWFKARSALGYGHDWPVDWREMWHYYDEVEHVLGISGPIRYPWGPDRGRYPFREHEVNAAGQVLARGAEAMGVGWCATPLATLSAPRGRAHPCVYRGFCKVGCSTNAKQSILNTYIPMAIEAGAEIRDLAMVGQVETAPDGRATGVVYNRQGEWRRQRAKHVVVAGYAVETPRLLLNSATPQHPDGLSNSSGLLGKCLMAHGNHAVWGVCEEEIRWYKGPPSMAVCEHWNYEDRGKDFSGGYSFMSQGPLPVDYAQSLVSNTGLFGEDLRREMALYNHMAGLKIVGEAEPREVNRVELDAEETDRFGLPRAHVYYSHSENDKRLKAHCLDFMSDMLDAGGAEVLYTTTDTAHLMGGCRMGTDPRDSVVDPYGRSWDIPNLWVCDGSLFPTSGGVNPSLTIMAMAARIGDHIVREGRRGGLG